MGKRGSECGGGGEDTLDKHFIEEESLHRLGGWNTLIHHIIIFFKDRKDETLCPTSLIRLTKEEEGGEKTELSAGHICLAGHGRCAHRPPRQNELLCVRLFEKALKMHLSGRTVEMIQCRRLCAELTQAFRSGLTLRSVSSGFGRRRISSVCVTGAY